VTTRVSAKLFRKISVWNLGVVRIDTKRGREALTARPEPYWQKLSRGRYLGLRKLAKGQSSWIARYRDEKGAQHYKALGEVAEAFDFDKAKDAAEAWMRDAELGVSDRLEDGKVATVASACRAYVRALKDEGRVAASHDAHMRFRRTVYGRTADSEFGPKPRKRNADASEQTSSDDRTTHAESKRPPRKWEPVEHAISNTALSKVRMPKLRSWHVELTSKGLSKAAANRTLTALKAALNFSVANRSVSAAAATEWAQVEPLKGAVRRRDLFLDIVQRRSLLANSTGGVRRLIEATMHTGCRAGELVSARRSAFDARTKSLSVIGKTGARAIPLADVSVALFAEFARDKLPSAYLLTRDDGKPWGHSDWDEEVKAAASRAKLPAGTCLYTLRHSFITQALLDGVSTLEVSKIVGTSLAMIEKHYGHLVHETARERLGKVQLV
jgi:integrase